MNILLLSPYPPFPPHGGGTMRIYQLLRGLAAHHYVTCLTFAPTAEAEAGLAPLRDCCRVLAVRGPAPRSLARRAWTTATSPLPDMALRNASPAYAAALRRLLAEEQFDVVQAESIEMSSQFTVVRTAVRSRNAARTRQHAQLILDQFNAEFVLQRRAFQTDVRAPRRWHAAAYSLAQWLKLAAYERRVMQACDAVLAVSEDDRKTLQRLAPAARIAVVPNGVDTAYFSRAALGAGSAPPGGPALVFSGTLDFRPNIDAVLWFAREVLPLVRAHRPDARLRVVGRRPGPALRGLASEAVEIVGEVPDARPHIAGAAVYVVPMRIGGGVRLKLLEALALEAPVVSTPMGAEGVAGLRDGEHCLLADTPSRFAAATLRLLDDPALGRRLGAAGRALVQAGYDWSVIVPRLEAVYQELAG